MAPKPLFADPVYDGAADPCVVWNKQEKRWYMFYTNRRATADTLPGVSWVHGTKIGVATSANGVQWQYADTADIQYRRDSGFTFWAPEVVEHKGSYHMYLTYVPGTFTDWKHPRYIIHLTSKNMRNWYYASTLKLANEKVIDACVHPLPKGGWRMWYNNEIDAKSIYYADSKDLYTWTDKGKAIGDRPGEGPKVFKWKGQYWMVVDQWAGLGVYRSKDLQHWEKQPERLLAEPGQGKEDGAIGQHPDVVIRKGRAFMYYFVHPGKEEKADGYKRRRSVIQLAELVLKDGWLYCDRDKALWL